MNEFFKTDICHREPVVVFGMSVETRMDKASVDCPHVWESAFFPRIAEFAGTNQDGALLETYGISIPSESGQRGAFKYMAAVAPGTGVRLPIGAESLELKGGPYVRCEVTSLGFLSDAFRFILGTWDERRPDYRIDRRSPVFEFYGKDFSITGSLEVYAALCSR